MTRHGLQILAYSIAGVVFAVVFEYLDWFAGLNAGIVAQWVVICIALGVASLVLLGVAFCILAVSPGQKKNGGLRGF